MKSMSVRHQSIVSYVMKGTTISNTALLMFHIYFGVFFRISSTPVLYYFNLLSIATYLMGYIILYKNLSNLYIALINIEVYIFMILGTVCLGWGYGFQQYCIIFVVSLLFTDYCVSKAHRLQKSTICLIALNIFTYFFLRMWTYGHPQVYHLESNIPEHVIFITNSIITFSFLIAYSFLYSQTVFRLERSLVEVASKDALTGLYNRRKMMDLLNAMSEILASTNPHLCIAMIDIDNFKRINDTYGHAAGDEILKSTAAILLQKSKEQESFQACRWGGEEFLIFYRNDTPDEEEIFREFDALRKQIAESTILYNDQKIHYTITIGLAFHTDNRSITDMIKLADDNLYKGKNSTKNVVIW